MRRTQQLANLLLPFFALIWPWDVYGYVPLLDMQATTPVAGALIVLLALDMVHRPRPNVPFSLLWPAAAIAAFALIASPSDGIGVAAAAVFFIAVVHFASDRGRALQCLWLTFFSAAAVATWSLVAFPFGFVPTASIFRDKISWMPLAFAHSLREGALALVLALLLGVALVPFVYGRRRWIVAAAALPPGASLLLLALQFCVVRYFLTDGGLRPLLAQEPWRFAVLMLALWLVARVAAVLILSRREAPEERHRLLLIPLLGGAVAALVLCATPRLGHAFLPGLIAAYGWAWRRETQPAMPRSTLVGAAVLAGLLVVVNISHVFLANTHDPRNYEAAVERAMAAGRSDDAESLLRRLEPFTHGEQRYHLWQARVSLALGQPLTSAGHFDAAANGSKGRRAVGLPAPSEAELDEFVVRMRDYASTHNSPLDRLAFARVLTALDRTNLALATIRPPTAAVEPARDTVESAPVLTDAVARVMGLDPTPDAMKQWPAEDLLNILESWGAQVEHEPGLPAPAVIVAQASVRGASLDVHVLTDTRPRTVVTPWNFSVEERPWGRLWKRYQDEFAIQWTFNLERSAAVSVWFAEDRTEVEAFQGKGVIFGVPVPATPAILILLP